jgi:hypothetical protein
MSFWEIITSPIKTSVLVSIFTHHNQHRLRAVQSVDVFSQFPFPLANRKTSLVGQGL